MDNTNGTIPWIANIWNRLFKGIVPPGNKMTFLTCHDLMAIMYRLEQYVKAEKAEKKKKI